MNKILGLDIGDVRIGIAISDALNMLASPLKIIDVNKEEPLEAIKKIVEENNIKDIVIGIPKSLDGTEKRQAEKVREFIAKIKDKIKNVNIKEIDERFTTTLAVKSFMNKGYSSKEYRGKLDSVSAALILQTYLDRIKK